MKTVDRYRHRHAPIAGEEKWVDYDKETACWGVFGVDSGFCYSLHTDEALANEKVNNHMDIDGNA